MLKNNKNDSNYISKDEAEKLLEYQSKVFYSKFEEQQKIIDEIEKCISDRFGENILSSGSLENKIKNVLSNENNDKYSAIIDELTSKFNKKMDASQNKHDKFIKDIVSQNSNEFEKIATKFKDIDDEVNKLNDILIEKDKSISGLAECIQKYILEEQDCIEKLQNKFIEADNKIDKISYTGITSKFDKKIKEQTKVIDKKIDDIESSITISKEETKNDIESIKQIQNIIQANIEDEKLQLEKSLTDYKNELLLQYNKFQNESTKSIDSINQKIQELVDLDNTTHENMNKKISKIKENTEKNITAKISSNTELLQKNHDNNFKIIKKELETLANNIEDNKNLNRDTYNNLQVKIKAYIDKKIENIDTNANNKMNAILNKLELSFAEKEKMLKIEFEQLLNKKLKSIQKENERIIKKEIEILNSNFKNSQNNNYNINDNTNFAKQTRRKMYDLMDENEVLKQSASNIKDKSLSSTMTGKSQLLKFFYDEEE